MLFIETSEFTKQLPAYLDDNDYAALQTFLTARPDAGDIIREGRPFACRAASWRKVVEEIKHG